jgi:hypothetical protein
MGTDKTRYLVQEKGSYYWRPNKRMRELGFTTHCLGKDPTAAAVQALRLNAEWDRYRRRETDQLHTKVYPPGSLGEAYTRAMKLREQQRADQGKLWTSEQRSRDDWPRAWRWIGPVFGDAAPDEVQAEALLALRNKVAKTVSPREAHRVIKVWRALWKKLPGLKYDKVISEADPAKPFSNPAAQPRKEEWPYRDVLKLVQCACAGGGCCEVTWTRKEQNGKKSYNSPG